MPRSPNSIGLYTVALGGDIVALVGSGRKDDLQLSKAGVTSKVARSHEKSMSTGRSFAASLARSTSVHQSRYSEKLTKYVRT